MKNIPVGQSILLITYGVVIGLLMGGMIWIVASPPRGKPVSLATRPPVQLIGVYISGEVVNPGVYQIPQGSRMKDLVELAGGFLASADISKVNQAALLTDSSQINILPVIATEDLENPVININTAS